MAWIEKRGRKYRVVFRYGGQSYQHALGTEDEQEAEACRARLKDMLNRLERGWLTLLDHVNVPLFLLSGGTVATRSSPPSDLARAITFAALRDAYLAAQEASLEAGSRSTLAIHLRHLERTLGAAFPLREQGLADLQRHIGRRHKQHAAAASR